MSQLIIWAPVGRLFTPSNDFSVAVVWYIILTVSMLMFWWTKLIINSIRILCWNKERFHHWVSRNFKTGWRVSASRQTRNRSGRILGVLWSVIVLLPLRTYILFLFWNERIKQYILWSLYVYAFLSSMHIEYWFSMSEHLPFTCLIV